MKIIKTLFQILISLLVVTIFLFLIEVVTAFFHHEESTILCQHKIITKNIDNFGADFKLAGNNRNKQLLIQFLWFVYLKWVSIPDAFYCIRLVIVLIAVNCAELALTDDGFVFEIAIPDHSKNIDFRGIFTVMQLNSGRLVIGFDNRLLNSVFPCRFFIDLA